MSSLREPVLVGGLVAAVVAIGGGWAAFAYYYRLRRRQETIAARNRAQATVNAIRPERMEQTYKRKRRHQPQKARDEFDQQFRLIYAQTVAIGEEFERLSALRSSEASPHEFSGLPAAYERICEGLVTAASDIVGLFNVMDGQVYPLTIDGRLRQLEDIDADLDYVLAWLGRRIDVLGVQELLEDCGALRTALQVVRSKALTNAAKDVTQAIDELETQLTRLIITIEAQVGRPVEWPKW
jgi:hypothetical protein